MPHSYTLERSQTIARPLEEVFDFFADAANLEAITPPWLNFQFVTRLPIDVRPGATIDYRLKLFGVPFPWRTQIATFTPSESFTDIQLRGPYKSWHHLHEFRATPQGTQMHDRVVYQLPYWLLGTAAHALFVQRMLTQIFDYRRSRVEELYSLRC